MGTRNMQVIQMQLAPLLQAAGVQVDTSGAMTNTLGRSAIGHADAPEIGPHGIPRATPRKNPKDAKAQGPTPRGGRKKEKMTPRVAANSGEATKEDEGAQQQGDSSPYLPGYSTVSSSTT